MGTNQASDIIRLGALIIPIIILFVAGQALRFDPNRRAARPSKTRAAIHQFEHPWGYIFVIVRCILAILLVLDLAEIAVNRPLTAILPGWAVFQNPSIEAIYATLALFAIWIVGRIKHLSLNTFDEALETHLDFSDWRSVDFDRDSRPILRMEHWRYHMKWWFKTNLEPITALQMRMVIDCPTFDDFEKRITNDRFPAGFVSIMDYKPWGRMLGSLKRLMQEVTLKTVFHADSLWPIWKNQPHPTKPGQTITTPHAMAVMLYDELRSLILCQECHNEAPWNCQQCQGSGALMHPCTWCKGNGIDAEWHRCVHCGSLGLQNRPIPVVFLDRLQYLWMARNIDYIISLFHVPLSNRGHSIIFGGSLLIFLIATLLFQPLFTVDLVVQALLFSSAALLGTVGAAIVVVFGTAFNSSGSILTPYPVQYSKYGNYVWLKLMNLIGTLTFGTLLIDTTFIMSQLLFEPHINVVLVALAASLLTMFVVLFSMRGFMSIHTAMRDAKRSRLDELEDWLYQQAHSAEATGQDAEYISQVEEFYKEIRQLEEWPLDVSTSLSIVSGLVLPVLLALGSLFSGNLVALFHR